MMAYNKRINEARAFLCLIQTKTFKMQTKPIAGSVFFLDYLTAPVHAGLKVDMVAAYGFARLRILDPVFGFQGMVGTAHVALGR